MLRKKTEVSQSAVEFALVIPILLLIVFGIFEAGHMVFVYASVLNAAREAARYGSVTGYINGSPQYEDCAGIANAATGLKFLADFTADNVEIFYDHGPGTAAIGPCSKMTSMQWSSIDTGSRVVVTVTSPYTLIVPIVPIPDFSMISTSRRTILGSVAIYGTVVVPPSSDQKPTISSIYPAAGPADGGELVTINGANLDNLSSVYFGDLAGIGCRDISATQVTCTTPTNTPGMLDVRLRTVYGTVIATGGYTFVAAPVVTNIDPSSGPLSAGADVTITGTGLSDGAVTFGDIGVPCPIDTDTQMICTPIDTTDAGPVNISVTTVGGSTTAGQEYTYVANPSITDINTTVGSTNGDNTVVINGTGLGGAAVTFDGITADCTANSDTQLTCTAPSHDPGQVSIAVTTTGGSVSTDGKTFTYKAAPAIVSIVPSAGPLAGGSTVVLYGRFLTNGKVKFGSTPADCVVLSDKKISCILPPAVSEGPVDVTVTRVDSHGSKLFFKKRFTYLLPPTITAIGPISGSAYGGSTVTITGTSLAYTDLTEGVIFDTMAATKCVVNSDTKITCTTPRHSSGLVNLFVTTLGGTASLLDAYTFTPGGKPAAGPDLGVQAGSSTPVPGATTPP